MTKLAGGGVPQLTRLQRNVALVTMVCFLAVTLTGMYIAGPESDHQEIIRFHVIANSNSDEDQELKLTVRDGILAEYGTQLGEMLLGGVTEVADASVTDGFSEDGHTGEISDARSYILRNLGDINALAEKIIREQGFDYTSESKLGVTYIPAKSYDDIYFPAGNYEALNIVIGEGQGENWWCVLFPPLCLIDGRSSSQDGSGKVQKSKKAIVLKSKVKEIAKKYQRVQCK